MEKSDKTIEQPNKWTDLLFFTAVPASQLLSFFVVSEQYKNELDRVETSLKMSEGQLIFFEVLMVLLYSVIVFLVSYFISRLAMGWVSEKVQKDKLFISFVLGISFTNLTGTLLFDIFHHSSGILSAVIQVALLVSFYCGFTKAKDLMGALMLGIVNVVFNIVPLLFMG